MEPEKPRPVQPSGLLLRGQALPCRFYGCLYVKAPGMTVGDVSPRSFKRRPFVPKSPVFGEAPVPPYLMPGSYSLRRPGYSVSAHPQACQARRNGQIRQIFLLAPLGIRSDSTTGRGGCVGCGCSISGHGRTKGPAHAPAAAPAPVLPPNYTALTVGRFLDPYRRQRFRNGRTAGVGSSGGGRHYVPKNFNVSCNACKVYPRPGHTMLKVRPALV
jgi:hypothetical protein